MDNAELEKLTLEELRQLKLRIEEAIRASIRNSKKPVDAAQPIDLEQARDAWLKSRK